MNEHAIFSLEHLLVRLHILRGVIGRAIDRQAAWNRKLAVSEAKGLYLLETQVRDLLKRLDVVYENTEDGGRNDGCQESDRQWENELRQTAASKQLVLPFDQLAAAGLTRREQDALALCAAPEIDRTYERLYAFILDDLNRRTTCVALLAELTSATTVQRAAALIDFGPFGNLRRRQLLTPVGAAPLAARQELRLGPGVLEFLLQGSPGAASAFRDPEEIELSAESPMAVAANADWVERLGTGLRAGTVAIVGIWGPRDSNLYETALAVCRASGRTARRLATEAFTNPDDGLRAQIRHSLLACSATNSLLCVDIDDLIAASGMRSREMLAEELGASPVPTVLYGQDPWRPMPALLKRSYCELELDSPTYRDRLALWQNSLHALDADHQRELSSRYRFGARELQAVSRLATTRASLAGNGRPEPMGDHVDLACKTVAQPRSSAFVRSIRPRRTKSQLVLPETLHRQVMEIARYAQVWPRVADEWGFAASDIGSGCIRALFTGDSGTGKTLAAEAIAFELGLLLMKVDLASVVSKWVGETEKNLANVFDEAQRCHAVLFFDEADALFGRRGTVERGTDRYANLEVSYLLQRLEEHGSGVIILASNLRENMDEAFTRRFQVALHFPRPATEEKRRLWRIAFPPAAPVDAGLDVNILSQLDLTGGGIVGAVHTAALLAAEDDMAAIDMRHVVQGVARQFKREARLLTAADLGPYASLLETE